MPTVLHISDLHRTSNPRLSNDELLSALLSDAKRWDQEGLPWPDLVVVSGDLIQGSRLTDSQVDSEIATQYNEAESFLHQLTVDILDSDRSRMIIVPGNHDVNWNRARQSMRLLAACPEDIQKRMLEATSGIRWNWSERQAYEIVDNNMYKSRFQHFRDFRSNFYAGLNPSPLVDGNDVVYADYPSLGLLVVGFASWHGNDCFCHVGGIDSESLSFSQKLLQSTEHQIPVAVWHHGIVGGPLAHDYMDARCVHRLIDFGFSLGLHGHQHFPGAAPFELRLPNLTSMAVVGAGSFAVGDDGLPMGERRQYNIVVIDTDTGTGTDTTTIHVRAMSPAGVFMGSHRDDFGGKTSVSLNIPPSPARRRGPTVTQRLDEAMTAARTGQYEKALEVLLEGSDVDSHMKRRVQIEAFSGLGQWKELIDLLDPPQNQDEAIKLLSVLLDNGRLEEASTQLDTLSGIFDSSVLEGLRNAIAARRALS